MQAVAVANAKSEGPVKNNQQVSLGVLILKLPRITSSIEGSYRWWIEQLYETDGTSGVQAAACIE